ncbi:isochorismatase family protein [Actinocorallia longicatena]|uniref:Cysteine hydrolase family protein n=1 Tax=Actinocorallia longicatena TaxID=111803 RepID=A0ABP6QPV0_9ACTN
MERLKRALVVIDVQNEHVAGALPIGFPETSGSLPQIGRAMDTAHLSDVPIAVIQHSAPPEFALFARGSRAWRLHPVVTSRPYDKLIEKAYPSTFTGTDFDWWLADNDVDTLTLAGFMTNICLDATAREAAQRGLAVEILSDASGTLAMSNRAGWASAERLHESTLISLHARFSAVATTAEWIAAVRSGEPLPQPDLIASTELGRGVAF